MRVPTERAEVPSQKITLTRLLLVEGETPLNFFDTITKDLGLRDLIEVRSFKGNGDLSEYLKLIASTHEVRTGFVRSIGIIRDCEDDRVKAEHNIQSAIKAANVPNGVKVVFHVLPSNANTGMIETLLCESVQSDPVWPCVANFEASVVSVLPHLPQDQRKAKRLAEMFLATRPDPQLMPGIAAARGYFPLNHSVFDELKRFLLDL